MPNLFKLSQFSMNTLVNQGKSLLLDDKVIALPTDTVYGLAAHVNSNKAIQRLYEIKSRDSKKPLAICLSDIEEISEYAVVTIEENLIKKLLPGALTLMFKRKKSLNKNLNPNIDLVAIRVPNHEFVRQLCRSAGPLALTSANISNQLSCLQINEFQELFSSIDAIFDGGLLGQIDPYGLGSTIVDLSHKNFYSIVRKGCVYEKTIEILDQHGLKTSH